MLKNVIKKNSYYDSATLMLLTSKVAPEVGGSHNIAVMMASEMNKDLMRNSGLLAQEGEDASPNDLVFAVKADDEATVDAAIAHAMEILEAKQSQKAAKSGAQTVFDTTAQALEEYPEPQMAVVSLPGNMAHIEVKRLLNAGVNVLLFSDNMSIENENQLKYLAIEKGLLMMGPDCGTAVVNGIGLGFANKVSRGNVGIVAASGTGLQEVMTLVSNFGGGISQALGTGGRDLKEAVGGKMMLHAIDMLEADPQTDIIAIVSKPPAPAVVEKLARKIDSLSKPVVACLLGDDSNLLGGTEAKVGHTLTDTAQLCLDMAAGDAEASQITGRADTEEIVSAARAALSEGQRYIRGLYCGGTLSYETQLIIADEIGMPFSNAPLNYDYALKDVTRSEGHTVLDLGDDAFTVGKPHPMIEPSLRGERLLQEALDPETAVIVLDIETGYGAHDEAGKILADEVREARAELAKVGREVAFFANICGSYQDYQDYRAQEQILEEAGIRVFETNEHCARAAVAVVK
ncbi:acyl-CoA synthetase FdrA [Dermabacteraceae bacterium P7006]